MTHFTARFTTHRNPLRSVAVGLCMLTLGACGSNNNNNDDDEPFAEILAQGINRYLGIYTPMTSEEVDGVVTHTFGTGDGPLCLDGSEYRMATYDVGSENLVIFLQGGGACWSTLCAATDFAGPGIPQTGILDPMRADNPVKDWNQVYLPYCDGGLHSSDANNDYDNDGIVETPQRGLHNLSAALDVAVTNFPSPNRILLTGASGGGYGTTFALALVRHLYPDVPIEVVNDSGVGIGKPGQPEFLQMLQTDWNQTAFIPESCEDCLSEDGHLINYLNWQLDQDPNTRRSILTSKQDFVIGTTFLQIGGPAHEAAVLPALAKMEAAHPERFRSWVTDGSAHTYIQLNPDQTAGGVKAIDFITSQLNGTDDWVSVSD